MAPESQRQDTTQPRRKRNFLYLYANVLTVCFFYINYLKHNGWYFQKPKNVGLNLFLLESIIHLLSASAAGISSCFWKYYLIRSTFGIQKKQVILKVHVNYFLVFFLVQKVVSLLFQEEKASKRTLKREQMRRCGINKQVCYVFTTQQVRQPKLDIKNLHIAVTAPLSMT